MSETFRVASPDPLRDATADSQARMRDARWRLVLGLAIVMAVSVRAWAATQWPANFQSDEAVFGLMSRHIMAGQFTPTLYGPAYLGSIESIISAGFMSVFGPSVMAFRMSALLLFGVFFILHAIFTSRYFGYPVAFISLLFLALPSFHVLEWTYQPVGAYGAMFVIGTLMLLASVPVLSGPRARVIRAGAMGLLTGLGLWSNNTMVLYLAAIGLVAYLTSPEWRSVYSRLSEFARRILLIPLAEIMPLAVFGVAGLGVLTFFSGSCRPEGLYATIGSIARTILVAVCLGLAASAFAHSRRRRQLGLEAVVLGVGFGVGYSPLLYQWLAKGTPPYWAVYPSCPEGAASRARLLVKDILPALWGIPTFAQLKQMTPPPLAFWILIVALTLSAIALFLWRHRVTCWRIFSLSPLDTSIRPLAVIVLVFAAPIMISMLAGNTIDLYSIRHTLMVTQASAITFAVFLSWLLTRFRRTGVLVTACWVLVVGVANLAQANTGWQVKFTRYDPQDLAQLDVYLEENDIKYAYADYWGAYTLDFLLGEKTIIAPFNGIDRYPPYTQTVGSANELAYIFPATNAPIPTGSMVDLQSFLVDADNPIGEGAAYPRILAQLKGQQVAKTDRVAVWDVWIVADGYQPSRKQPEG